MKQVYTCRGNQTNKHKHSIPVRAQTGLQQGCHGNYFQHTDSSITPTTTHDPQKPQPTTHDSQLHDGDNTSILRGGCITPTTTHDPQPTTHNPQPPTHDPQPTNKIVICFLDNIKNESIIYLWFHLLQKCSEFQDTKAEILTCAGCGLWAVGCGSWVVACGS